MEALVFTENNTFELQDIMEPQIELRDQVKVKIFGTGVCGTDLNILKGKISATPGMVIGHEAVGTVVETGDGVQHLSVGDRVVIDPTQFCGKCDYCRKGLTCFCDTFDDFQLGIGAHGTYTDYYVGEERFMYKIPPAMSWETAILVEPLTCIMNIFEKARVKPVDSVLVLGSGTIGMLCQMVSKRLARLTVATEISPYRKEIANKIADYVYLPHELTEEEILRINGGKKFTVILDSVGNQLDTAVNLIEKGGRIVPLAFDETYNFSFNTMHFLSNGISIIGTGEVHQMTGTALEYAESFPDLEMLITKKLPINKWKEAFRDLLGYDLETGERSTISSMKTILLSNGEN
ncbi:MAG: alcohol dehydrogenase catalytic domain-containing protein [bacterium]|nr:alcohol dehydrogenase catalytic domain-containing protein [bacterium]